MRFLTCYLSHIQIWIKDPEKVELTRMGVAYGSYFTYLVRTESALPGLLGANAAQVEVRRRFSDFDALHNLLKMHYRGYFIPPLPEKGFFDSRFAGDSFLKVRRVDLQVSCVCIATYLGAVIERRRQSCSVSTWVVVSQYSNRLCKYSWVGMQ